MFLSRWPEAIPKRWIPGLLVGRVTWGLVLACSVFIAADKSGFLEDCFTDRRFSESFRRPSLDLSVRDTDDTGRHLGADGTEEPNGVRRVAQSSSSACAESSSADSSCASSGGHASHQHEALMFLFNAIMIGTIMTHLTTFRFFAGLQQTVVLFILGLTYSLVQEGLEMHTRTGIMGRSYVMWMRIDPHLILFTMLPALLTGDAMNLDTSVARRVAKQCVYLASVGVCLNGFLTAAFLSWYLQWPFLLSLTTGAILCATDPVAVVALLKELGASPTLTVLIQGESLLNDGTAIVLYTISYNMLKGENYDGAGIIIFVVKKAMCAWGLGMVLGWVFLRWISLASNKLESHNTVIQVSLTLCCSYWSFCIAEGVFGISGVLATVAAALVLAHSMWAHVVSKESMHTFWHMLEYLGNTVIFFLAGALTGKTMVHIPLVDYLHLLVIYLVLIIIRAAILIVSKPILRRLSEEKADVSLAEIVVMTWGGLRGAVGLALAIQVTVDQAEGAISAMDANRVLFFVGGVAALTLIVNATTCPSIVNALGVTQLPKTKLRLLQMLRRRLMDMCNDNGHPEDVTKGIKEVLLKLQDNWDLDVPSRITEMPEGEDERDTVIKDIDHGTNGVEMKPKLTTTSEIAADATNRKASGVHPKHQSVVSLSSGTSLPAGKTTNILTFAVGMFKQKTYGHATCRGLIHTWRQALNDFSEISQSKMKLLNYTVPEMPFTDQQDLMEELFNSTPLRDQELLRAVTEAFLAIVRSRYWHFMEVGDLPPGSFEADVLMNSVASALAHPQHELLDWKWVVPCIAREKEKGHGNNQERNHVSHALMDRWKAVTPDFRNAGSVTTDEKSAAGAKPKSFMHRVTESTLFNAIIMSTIILNSAFIFVEEELRAENDDSLFWLVVDILFNVIFTIEFILKFCDQKHRYFLNSWNVFDFILVLFGIGGFVVNVMSQDQGQQMTGIARAARAFRVMRLIRLVRIVKFLQVLADKMTNDEASLELRLHLQTVGILTCFIRAHVESQRNLLLYFGTIGSSAKSTEVAQIILQSEVAVFRAIKMTIDVQDECASAILDEVKQVQESKRLAEELETFVLGAHQSGVISSGEARSLVKPLRDHVEECQKLASLKMLTSGKSRLLHDAHSRKSTVTSIKSDPHVTKSERTSLASHDTPRITEERATVQGLETVDMPNFCNTTESESPEKSRGDQSVDTQGADNRVMQISPLSLGDQGRSSDTASLDVENLT